MKTLTKALGYNPSTNQKRLWEAMDNNNLLFVRKSRQVGFSSAMQAMIATRALYNKKEEHDAHIVVFAESVGQLQHIQEKVVDCLFNLSGKRFLNGKRAPLVMVNHLLPIEVPNGSTIYFNTLPLGNQLVKQKNKTAITDIFIDELYLHDSLPRANKLISEYLFFFPNCRICVSSSSFCVQQQCFFHHLHQIEMPWWGDERYVEGLSLVPYKTEELSMEVSIPDIQDKFEYIDNLIKSHWVPCCTWYDKIKELYYRLPLDQFNIEINCGYAIEREEGYKPENEMIETEPTILKEESTYSHIHTKDLVVGSIYKYEKDGSIYPVEYFGKSVGNRYCFRRVDKETDEVLTIYCASNGILYDYLTHF